MVIMDNLLGHFKPKSKPKSSPTKRDTPVPKTNFRPKNRTKIMQKIYLEIESRTKNLIKRLHHRHFKPKCHTHKGQKD